MLSFLPQVAKIAAAFLRPTQSQDGSMKDALMALSAGTHRRPVPLQHALYYNNELYTICTKEVFNSDGIRAATAAYKKKNEVGPVTGTTDCPSDKHNRLPTGPVTCCCMGFASTRPLTQQL
jgi:hypothetical protein